ncbi:MAG: WYL domain-containing protein [Ruminococcaceae bacterium]|nr:WYL domain-containing protein [Oscillospiraceae bacterium]
MAGNPKQKLKLLYIADYLRRYSDEQHAVSVADIIAHLEQNGVQAERKSIYNDLSVLREYGMPIERGMAPMQGYYLTETEFEPCELMLLMDTIQASPVISQRKTAALSRKLCSMTSVYTAEKLCPGITDNNYHPAHSRIKSDNEEFYYSIDQIHTAIMENRKLRFIYHHRVLAGNLPVFNAGREFIISPYAAIWHQDKYYVVGNYEKYDDLSHYRIDHMKKVQCISQPARPLSEVSDYTDRFDAADYTRKVFNMYAGTEPVSVELECEDRLLEAMIERFGINVPYRQLAGGRFTVKAHAIANEGFENWILNFGGGVVVRAPAELRQSIKKKLAAMAADYSY